jgi:hypothetical protein
MNKALLRNITEWIEWEKFWRGKTSRPLAPLVKPYSFPCVALLIIFTQGDTNSYPIYDYVYLNDFRTP